MVSVRCWQATPRIAVVSLEVEERRPGLFPWRAVGNQSRRSRQSAVPAGRCADSQPQAAAPRISAVSYTHLVASDLVYRDKVGETYSVKPNPEHRWYYYPHLLPEEALLLKIYDSREDAQARLGAHTAFDDPCTPADAPPRQSIELRCLLFFDE